MIVILLIIKSNMIMILVIHIILPTQTIHHFSPNHWKLPYICSKFDPFKQSWPQTPLPWAAAWQKPSSKGLQSGSCRITLLLEVQKFRENSLVYPPGNWHIPKNCILKMFFLFPRWDMLISWRVPQSQSLHMVYFGLFFAQDSSHLQDCLCRWSLYKPSFATHWEE